MLDSYRGISLIAVALKLVSTIVIRRISEALEKAGRLRRDQAGFRRREECTGQAVALYEVLQRRKVAGKKSYLVFIDYQKAYDTVPHELCFASWIKSASGGRPWPSSGNCIVTRRSQCVVPLVSPRQCHCSEA